MTWPVRREPAAADRETWPMYDVIGIGYGPANLALMATIDEESKSVHGRPLQVLFLEQRERFAWHPGMLIENTRIQLSFIKDLVTLRNPRSRYSFLSYLKDKGRLDEFANLRNFFPTRREFNDYYRWVADQLDENVRYNYRALSVIPVRGPDDRVELLAVESRDLQSGERRTFVTRNLVLATGGAPFIPRGIDIDRCQHLFHTCDFLQHMTEHFTDRSRHHRFAVVGSGQSAAEIFHYLFTSYPKATVGAALRRFAYKPADDSHFVNEIFFPRMKDLLFDLPPQKRQLLLQAHRDTNYSAVDLDLIEDIYDGLYQSKVNGEARGRIYKYLELVGASEGESGLVLRFRDILREQPVLLEVDAAVLATGYQRPKKHPLLAELSSDLEELADGSYKIDRSYAIETRQRFLPRVFLQGFCEDVFGLTETLLSTLPHRSYEIFAALLTDQSLGIDFEKTMFEDRARC